MKNVHIGWGPVGMTKILLKENTKLKLNNTLITMELDATHQLVINSEYEETPEWKSSNEDVVKVDQNGLITAVGYGTAYITVTSGNLKGTCIVSIPEPIIPDEPDEPVIPDEPTNNLDNTKIYYGTIQSPQFMNFSELTEEVVAKAVEAGTLKTTDLNLLETDITVYNQGDVVLVLIPSGIYKSGIIEIDGSKHGFIDSVTGTNFHSNGEVRLGDFYVFGQWMFATGLLKIYVE